MKLSTLFSLGLGFAVLPFYSVSAASIGSGFLQSNAYETDHFSIEFSDLILGQVDENGNGLPDIVDTVAEAVEYSRSVILDDLGYSDVMEGYDRKIIVSLDENHQYLQVGAEGSVRFLSNGDPFISLDPFLDESTLQATIAHEYFHCAQFAYGVDVISSGQRSVWREATAVWVQDLVYDESQDYLTYLSQYFDYLDYSVFATAVPSGTLFQYGLNIWPQFLSEYFESGVIREIWETYVSSSKDYLDDRKLYDAVDSVVQSNGKDLRTVFRDFTLWNLDVLQYDEGAQYPGVFTLDGDTDPAYQPINEGYAPALFGSNYIYFANENADPAFYFHIAKPEGVAFAVTVVPYDEDSERPIDLSEKQSVILGQNEGMDEVLKLERLKNAEGVYAIVSPLDTAFEGDHTVDFDQGYLYNFFAQYGEADEDWEERLTGVDAETSVETETTTDAKDGVDASEEVVPVTTDLRLNLVNYDEDSVSFSWNRLIDSDIAGYELRYGTSSGDYDKEQSVDHAYLTAATVSGLEEGTPYYFEIVAVNDKGHSVGSPSSELSITPAQWLFTDLSYLDAHYNSIANLVEMSVFSGYANGSFRPNDTINRAELLKILVEGRGLSPDAATYQNCFSDVKAEWYAKYVCYAKAQGWVSGYSDGNFRPGNAVNRVEALKILFQVYQAGLQDGPATGALAYSDLSQTAWYAVYVAEASELGILEEEPGQTFDPTQSRTRAEMAEELYRYLVRMELIKE